MRTLNPSDLSTLELQGYLQHAIAPRPICFASTVDQEGRVNLSPFSFFNLFSTNPPICIFSPARRVRDNTTKHTLENIMAVPEVVINIVNYRMVQQTSLASTEFPKGVNEFDKAGLTMEPATLIQPPRVKQAPVQLECRVTEIKPLGDGPGAGNLIFAQVLLIHIHEEILDDHGMIDQAKIDLVARLGGNWYCRVTRENLFQVEKPLRTIGIGIDALPLSAQNSPVLTGNDLGILGNLPGLPDPKAVEQLRFSPEIKAALIKEKSPLVTFHQKAKALIADGRFEEALLYIFLEA